MGVGVCVAPPGMGGGEVEGWSSDWEDMQEGIGEVFVEPLNPPKSGYGEWSVSLGGGGVEGDSFLHKTLDNTQATLPLHKNASSKGKKSSGMKLVGPVKMDTPPPPPRRTPSLGEEFDVMAIKVNKKRDAELDLFADLAPSFNTKKFNLETLLLEANRRAKGDTHTHTRTPSVSETLAGLDTNMGEDAWGQEGGWGDPIDLTDVPSPPSNTRSPVKTNQWGLDAWPDLITSDQPSEANGVVGSLSSTHPPRLVKDTWDDSWGDDF